MSRRSATARWTPVHGDDPLLAPGAAPESRSGRAPAPPGGGWVPAGVPVEPEPEPEPTLAVLGTHGGAGATTVTRLLQLGGASAVELSVGQQLPVGAAPVLVARSTASGTAAAAATLAAWHVQVPRPWLVLVADAPAPEPPAARYRVRACADRIRGVHRVPWLWAMRAVDDPGDAARSRPVARAAERLAVGLVTAPDRQVPWRRGRAARPAPSS